MGCQIGVCKKIIIINDILINPDEKAIVGGVTLCHGRSRYFSDKSKKKDSKYVFVTVGHGRSRLCHGPFLLAHQGVSGCNWHFLT